MIQLMIAGGSKVTRSETVATIAAHEQAAVIAKTSLHCGDSASTQLTRENLSFAPMIHLTLFPKIFYSNALAPG